jgi:hypothetical protein
MRNEAQNLLEHHQSVELAVARFIPNCFHNIILLTRILTRNVVKERLSYRGQEKVVIRSCIDLTEGLR